MKTSHYYVQGEPGDWRIYHAKGGLVERVGNRGQALTILKGLENPSSSRRVRYSFRKVYAYLRSMGWRIMLKDPPDVFWTHPTLRWPVKENHLLSPKEFLLSCYRNVPGGDKETLEGYWTWHAQRARTDSHGNQDRTP